MKLVKRIAHVVSLPELFVFYCQAARDQGRGKGRCL